MARKWSNQNLPGALHFVTGSLLERMPVFTDSACCNVFLQELHSRDGRIKEFTGALKSLSAKRIVQVCKQFRFHADADGHRVWQESFKAIPLWSGWMIWQKINYIHANPVKAGIVKSAKDYPWSSFRSFCSQGDEELAADRDWSWPDDAEKLSKAVKEMDRIVD